MGNIRTNFNTILCDDSSSFDTDVIILGLGIIINIELAEKANPDVLNGIKVNRFVQITNEEKKAIGDYTTMLIRIISKYSFRIYTKCHRSGKSCCRLHL